jgi:hypothetical protein
VPPGLVGVSRRAADSFFYEDGVIKSGGLAVPPNLLLFFGAGASQPLGIPTTEGYYPEFLSGHAWSADLDSEFPAEFRDSVVGCGFKTVDVEILMSILSALAEPNQEDAMSSLGRVGSAYESTKAGRQLMTPKSSENASKLLKSLKQYIRTRCSAIPRDKLRSVYDPILHAFDNSNRRWQVRGRDQSLNWDGHPGFNGIPDFACFTTNYDCALEAYFEEIGIDYSLGFRQQSGQMKLDSEQIRLDRRYKLNKLHGSVDMMRLGTNTIVQTPLSFDSGARQTLRGETVTDDVVIYPTQEKVLFRFPFLDYFYELMRSLRYASIWAFFGFSFRDESVRRLVETEATSSKKILVVAPHAQDISTERLSRVSRLAHVIPIDGKVGGSDMTDLLVAKAVE